jgi:hypothetical protein
MTENVCCYSSELKDSKIELVLDCRSCKQKNNSRKMKCLNNIVRTIEKEFNINSITMLNYSLTQFKGDGVKLLKRIVKLRMNIQSMKERKVLFYQNKREKLTKGKSGIDQRCVKCQFNPSDLFSKLNDRCYPDFDGFLETIIDVAKMLGEYVGGYNELDKIEDFNFCSNCISGTYKDLTFLFVQYRDFVKHIRFQDSPGVVKE